MPFLAIRRRSQIDAIQSSRRGIVFDGFFFVRLREVSHTMRAMCFKVDVFFVKNHIWTVVFRCSMHRREVIYFYRVLGCDSPH